MDLNPFIEKVEKLGLKVEGVIVCKWDGEWPGALSEYACHRWIPESRRNVHSVSKSFTSVAVGMAIDEGKLKLSDRVTRVFPRGKSDTQAPVYTAANAGALDSRWDALTLEHLLTMNMGHPVLSRPRTVREAVSYELSRDPGTCFFYDNTCTFLASAMLTEATGFKLRDYLLDRLFRPLGISDPEWQESEDGYTIGATGLSLTTSEMALFGRFLLQKGSWEGKQLVSASWIERAARTQVSTQPNRIPDYDLGYGYCFWMCRHGAYRCDGRDGQYIIVFPALDAVVAINSNEENQNPILWAVWDYILPQL